MATPPESLEAAARATHDQWRHECAVEADEPVENWREWDELDRWEQDSFREQARAACLAMLEAWPGMWEAVNGAVILPSILRRR